MFKLRQGLVSGVPRTATRYYAARIRPQVPLKNTGPKANDANPKNFRMLRLLVIMGGLAVASFFIGPAKAKPLPPAARDSLKRKVVVIFVVGDSGTVATEAAKEHNCVYIKFPVLNGKSLAEAVTAAQGLLAPHVSAGTTRFVIDQIPAEALPDMEARVVDPDLIVNFGPENETLFAKYVRSSRLAQVASKQELDSVLKDRNMD